jgi:hypothetical protein
MFEQSCRVWWARGLLLVAAIAARGVAAEPSGEETSGTAAIPLGQQLLTFPVQVVDEAGRPVAGAEVVPWALRCSQGHGLWSAKSNGGIPLPRLTTDSAGRATVPYPKYDVLDERILTTEVTLSIDHPDFARTDYENVLTPRESTDEHRAILKRGGVVEILPTEADEAAALDDLFVSWSDARSWTPGWAPAKTADGRLRLPPMPAGPGQALVVRLDGDRATHFSPILDVELQSGETLRVDAPLRPCVRITGAVGENVPRPVAGGRLSAESLSKRSGPGKVVWHDWAAIAEDGTFVIERWPADAAIQITALCDGFVAASGAPPVEVDARYVPSPWRAFAGRAIQTASIRLQLAAEKDAASHFVKSTAQGMRGLSQVVRPDFYLRPQVFRPEQFARPIALQMEPRGRCEVVATDAEGRPLAGVEVAACPNVGWWNDGSQVYCSTFSRSEERLRVRGAAAGESPFPYPFSAVTDAAGRATLELPPGREWLYAESDDWELPIDQGWRQQGVATLAGETTRATLVLDPKGTELLGDWDKLAGVLFGCRGEQCRRLLEDEGFRKQMEEVSGLFNKSENTRDPKLLARAYKDVAKAFDGLEDQEEAARWRRKAEEQAKKSIGDGAELGRGNR